MSDVHLTENCGQLKKLLPGDMILADRIHYLGFCRTILCRGSYPTIYERQEPAQQNRGRKCLTTITCAHTC